MATLPLVRSVADYEMLLRETNHRSRNDLQLVVGLLSLHSRRSANPEARRMFADVMQRVAALAHARNGLDGDQAPDLEAALRQLCAALHAQTEPRSISVSLSCQHAVEGLSMANITTLVLVVNELATNAIKHAFADGQEGRIRVRIACDDGGDVTVTVTVDDDGMPFVRTPGRTGLGLELVERMMGSVGGVCVPPSPGSKSFVLRIPIPGKLS